MNSASVKQVFRRIGGIALSALLGAVFIYSGYAKLWPFIETFELTLIDAGLANWQTAPILARLIIGVEFFLGTCLLFSFRLRRFTVPAVVAFLFAMCIYLLIGLVKNGNTFNCGCFGEHIIMSPAQALMKNTGMIGAAILAAILYEGWNTKRARALTAAALVIACALPFIINRVDYQISAGPEEKTGYPLPLDLLYTPEDTTKVQIPSVDLRRGKHVLALMSLGCPHCRIAARKFRVMLEHDPSLPVYFLLNGEAHLLPVFFRDTGTEFIPHSMCLGRTFSILSGGHLPRIYFISDGIISKKVFYTGMDEASVRAWLSE